MEYTEVLTRILGIAVTQFPKAEQEFSESTTASDIASWDSLNHVMFMAAIEKSFGIKFDLLQMIGMKSLGDISSATLQALK